MHSRQAHLLSRRALARGLASGAGLVLFLIAGCVTPAEPDTDLATRELVFPGGFEAAAGHESTEPTGGWLAEFGDPTLLALVEEALAHNPDLRGTAAVWSESRARLRVASSYLSPRFDVAASAGRTRGVSSNRVYQDTQYSVSGEVSWELDVWGRLRSDERAAVLASEASGLDYAWARQSLAATVTEAWLLAIQAHEQLAIDLELLEAERRTSGVTTDKVETGTGTQLESELAEANVSLAESAVTNDRAAIDELTRALEALIGRYPSAELAVRDRLPPFPGEAAVGVPSGLLERRPDLAAADRRVAAAFHRRESARAARLPGVTLTASLGMVLEPTHSIWSIGADLLAPVLNGGRLDAAVEITTSQQEQALASYVGVAIDAFREVETALATEQYLARRERELTDASERLRAASRVGEDRYNAGVLSIVDLMTIRRQDFQSRSDLLRLRTDRLRERLALYRALGGSFDEIDAAGVSRETDTADQEQS